MSALINDIEPPSWEREKIHAWDVNNIQACQAALEIQVKQGEHIGSPLHILCRGRPAGTGLKL
ncbi:MAG: hypothetical protein QM487_10635 [Candidatus Marithrix sp.]